jgi:hypothetical protein
MLPALSFLSEKARVMVMDEGFERHRRHHPQGTSRHRSFNGYQGGGHQLGFGGGNRNQPDGQN